jgi:predicted dehydrogenase
MFSSDLYTRKTFLKNMSVGILTATSLPLNAGNDLEDSTEKSSPGDVPEEKLPRSPLNHSTEQEEPAFYPAPRNPAKRVGYAIVGLGHLALTDVMPAFANSKYSKPVALVSGDAHKAKVVAEQYGINPMNIYDYNTFDRIADNKEIEAVYIILPNSMHHEFTIRAAKAGKHVLCEKPMANSAKECEEMIDACKKANRKLMIAYRIQYEPNNALIRDWVQQKKYGNVKLMELFNGQNIGDPSQWRLKKSLAGGGSLPDVGIYCLNTARYLLGEEPDAVSGFIHTTPGDIRFKEVEESVMFQLHFPSGVIANCGTTYGAHMTRRYRLFADAGAWFGMDPAFSYKGIRIELSQSIGKIESKQYPAIEEKDQFALEIDHFSECVRNDKKPFTPGEEGLQDQRIIDAIYQAAKEGKVVSLKKYDGKDVFRGEVPKDDK